MTHRTACSVEGRAQAFFSRFNLGEVLEAHTEFLNSTDVSPARGAPISVDCVSPLT